jgi:hypothetical protein
MKHSLHLARAAAVAALATLATLAPVASAVTGTCGEFTPQFIDQSCSLSGFGSSESTAVIASSTQTTKTWSYVTNMITGSGLNPRAAAILISSSGGRIVSTAGTFCPQAVDNTANGLDGFPQSCTVSNDRPVAKVRVIFDHT